LPSRQRPAQREPVDVNAVAREAAELLAYSPRVDNIEVTLDLLMPEMDGRRGVPRGPGRSQRRRDAVMGPRVYFRLGSSSGLTYFTPQGPTPCTWTTVSSRASTKWVVPTGITTKLPVRIGASLPASKVSPIPK
jgi:hypothetical protein